MRTALFLFPLLLFFSCSSHEEVPEYVFNSDEMTKIESGFSPLVTEKRFLTVLAQKEIRQFNTIDHKSTAENIGENLRESLVITFGTAEIGTAIISCRQTTGIDLPMRILIYEDVDAKTWVLFNDPINLIDKHSIFQEDCKDVVRELSDIVIEIVETATDSKVISTQVSKSKADKMAESREKLEEGEKELDEEVAKMTDGNSTEDSNSTESDDDDSWFW
jgi:uncharacterized protein (DUF302 family)